MKANDKESEVNEEDEEYKENEENENDLPLDLVEGIC